MLDIDCNEPGALPFTDPRQVNAVSALRAVWPLATYCHQQQQWMS